MLHSIHRSTLRSAKCCCCINNLLPIYELYFPNLHSFSSSTGNAESNQHSIAENYLVKTFGLSLEVALKISKEFKCNIPEKSEALIALLKQHGFTHAQVSSVVKKCPEVLKIKLQNNLLPKIQFFHSLGLSSGETAKIITIGPYILKYCLGKNITPSYESLKSLLLSNESTIFAIKRYPGILSMENQKLVLANVERLLKAGAPSDKILHFLKQQPRVFMMQPDKFNACVEQIEEMGFNPRTTNFLCAILVLRMAGVEWSRKVEAYKKWGFSEIQVLRAFRTSPWFMATSVDKIGRVLDYFINDMGFDPFFLTISPQIMALSMEKTIVPRCTVYQVLVSKGLIKKKTSMAWFLKLSKVSFMKKFVLSFSEEAPEISKLYLQKLHLSK